MAHDGSEQPYFDILSDDPEVAAATMPPTQLLGSPGGLHSPRRLGEQDAPQHQQATQGGSRTTIVTSGQFPARNAPAYSYPATMTSARVGSHPSGHPTLMASPATGPAATASALNSYAIRSINPSPPYNRIGVDWQSSANTSLYGSDISPDVSAHSSVNPLDIQFAPSVTGVHQPGYISPSLTQNVPPAFDFPSAWAADTTSSSAAPMVRGPYPGMMPLPFGGGGGGDSLDGSPELSGSEGNLGDDYPSAQLDEGPQPSGPRSKRAKKSPGGESSRPGLSPGTAVSSAGSAVAGPSSVPKPANKSRLRSASRTSKNTQHRPSETADERKTRNSHNLVEKQYRNRLNAQFESLLNALPDSSRGGVEGDGDSDGPVDLGEKRVSKAEVLDMARRHIKTLEKERDALEQERNELLEGMDQLRDAYAKGFVQAGNQPDENFMGGDTSGGGPA